MTKVEAIRIVLYFVLACFGVLTVYVVTLIPFIVFFTGVSIGGLKK
jgi:hypothetical protein